MSVLPCKCKCCVRHRHEETLMSLVKFPKPAEPCPTCGTTGRKRKCCLEFIGIDYASGPDKTVEFIVDPAPSSGEVRECPEYFVHYLNLHKDIVTASKGNSGHVFCVVPAEYYDAVVKEFSEWRETLDGTLVEKYREVSKERDSLRREIEALRKAINDYPSGWTHVKLKNADAIRDERGKK